MVDGSFGFEMETFEFLNVLQSHGFPKVMGVLTHLDRLKTAKQLRKTKKELKSRFWTEIYNGAKLFYFSGISQGVSYLCTVLQRPVFNPACKQTHIRVSAASQACIPRRRSTT
jgi:selenocysteine-specific translation elongation factor